jgi:hypothetical protein
MLILILCRSALVQNNASHIFKKEGPLDERLFKIKIPSGRAKN